MTEFTSGYDSWCTVTKSIEKFSLTVNCKASHLYKNFQDAADYTANLLYKTWTDKPLYLTLSGGLDSEYTANTLLKNNIPFTPVILDIEGMNQAESWYARYWCKKNNIIAIHINLSIKQFEEQIFSKYFPETSKTTITPGIMISLFLLDYIENLNGYGIISCGDINYDFDEKLFYCDDIDFVVGMFRPGKHPSEFFMFTPEIALSYIYQFIMTDDEQYNKIRFYNILPRSKNDCFPLLLASIDERYRKIYEYRKKQLSRHTPHWYGTQTNIIDLLLDK